MLEVLYARRSGKGNGTNFYWEVVKVSVGSIQYGGVLKHFGTENCVWIFLSDFFGQNVSKYLNQFSIRNYT